MSMQTNEKKKASDPSLYECANCGTVGAKLTCAKCKASHYCSKACQKQHWKNGHKALCLTPEERRPYMEAPGVDASDRIITEESDSEHTSGECPICLDSFSGGTLCTLPCKHEFHRECVEALRKQGVQQACPLCRTALPPGPAKLFEDATRVYTRMAARRRAEGGVWKPQTVLEKKNMGQVVDMWTNAANQGHILAQKNLGSLYYHGSGVTQDYNEAVQWYRKAAGQGMAVAQFDLGVIYRHGQGVAQDYNEAVRWYRKAADQGYVHAQYNIGSLYYHGEGVAQDYNEAVPWYRKAAGQGMAVAQFDLGVIYHNGQGVAQDHNEAVRWYRKAADQGRVDAQCNLGSIYYHGQGIGQDYNKAVHWYRKAADQGSANAQYNLGSLYNHGQGVAQDYNEAVHWYHKAADQGHDSAQYNLGSIYYHGQGIGQDYNKAVQWFRKAADQGSANAQYNLGSIYYYGQGVTQDCNLAHFFLSAAEAQGDETAYELRKQVEATLHDTSSKCSGFDKPSSSQCSSCGRGAENGVKLTPCPRCKGPSYCGKDCQREHWKEGHKESCTKK